MKLLASFALVILIGLIVWMNFRPDASTAARHLADIPQVVFVCRDTGELFLGQARPTPARHPKTGQPTLLLGLYCPQCQEWRIAPAVEQLQHQSRPRCRKCRSPLELAGPLPSDAVELPVLP